MNSEYPKRRLKKIYIQKYNRPLARKSVPILVSLGSYGYCNLKIGREYQSYINCMSDFHLDQEKFKKSGLDSIEFYDIGDITLILARTEEGIEGIVMDYNIDEIENLSKEVLWVSIIDKGHLILNNLELKLFAKMNQDKVDF